MVFGDYARARWAARVLPRTPTQRGREEEDREKRKTATRPHTTHTTHTTATQRGNRQHDTRECNTRGTRQCGMPDLIQRQGTLRRRRGQHKTRGQHNNTPLPPFNGTTTQTEGGHHTQDGEASNTAALHSPCHPPSAMPPTIHDGPTLHHDEGGADRGYPTTRTAHTDTHHPHTTHLARNSARHDSSTCQHCSGTRRARATPLHWAGQQQHTPPPFHTPRRMDTIHSSIHLLSLTHVRTTDDQR